MINILLLSLKIKLNHVRVYVEVFVWFLIKYIQSSDKQIYNWDADLGVFIKTWRIKDTYGEREDHTLCLCKELGQV